MGFKIIKNSDYHYVFNIYIYMLPAICIIQALYIYILPGYFIECLNEFR